MLRICTEQDFEIYADFAYGLALDPSRSGYPTYCDGIKTKEMFVQRAKKAFARDTEEILLFERGGKVEGWIHYYWLPADRYLSTVSFNINAGMEEALAEFLALAEERFRGYDLLLGWPGENQAAAAFLPAHGFACIEEDYNNTAFLETCREVPVSGGIVRVTKENDACFRQLHEKAEGDMYWNADRICADLDRWIVFVRLRAGEPVGCVYYMDADDGWYEIFGIDTKDGAFDPGLFRELVGAALSEAKRRGGKYMTFFCGGESQALAEELGFTPVGRYVCFKKHLGP